MNPNDRPLVSVVVPTFNRRDLLPRALASIAAQTWRPLEVIVVNDAGQGVADIIDAFRGRIDIRGIDHPVNQGLAATRNTALRDARGEWIAYLDDDDLLLPAHVETLVNGLSARGAVIGYADSVRVESEPDGAGGFRELRRVPVAIPFDRDRLILDNYLPVQAVMHRREILDTCGHFDGTLRHREDWELWVRVCRRHDFVRIPTVTSEYQYRVGGASLSNDTRPDLARVRSHIYATHADVVLPAVDNVLRRLRRAEAAAEASLPRPGPAARLRAFLRGRGSS